jgi:hypothetical protein
MPLTKRSTNDSPAAPAVGMADGQSLSPHGELPADLELAECDGSVAVFARLGPDRGTRKTPSDDEGGMHLEARSMWHRVVQQPSTNAATEGIDFKSKDSGAVRGGYRASLCFGPARCFISADSDQSHSDAPPPVPGESHSAIFSQVVTLRDDRLTIYISSEHRLEHEYNPNAKTRIHNKITES